MEAVAPSAPSEMEGPPPYATLPPGLDTAGLSRWASGESMGSPSPGGPQLRLRGGSYGYMDFTPRVVRKRLFGTNQYEQFSTIVLRANSWLEEHPGVTVLRCETVTWSGRQVKDIFTDSCVFDKNMNAARNTKLVAGLRLWYHMEMMDSPARREAQTTHAIQCRTFLPKQKERFHQLINRVNKAIQESPQEGRVLSVETVRHLCPKDNSYRPSRLNANSTVCRQSPARTKKFVYSLRLFTLLTATTAGAEVLGYQDFVPEHNHRNKENKGYELFSDVMLRASRWVASQRGVRFTNVQTLRVKIKRRGEYPERCVYSEHRSARNRLNCLAGPNRTTRYLHVVRTYFVLRAASGQGGESAGEEPVRLTYRTFTPSQCTRATAASPAEYEHARQLMTRINQWLQITGARVFSMETICMSLTNDTQQLLGPEATYTENSKPTRWQRRTIYQLRIYLDGEYVEPPQAVGIVIPTMIA